MSPILPKLLLHRFGLESRLYPKLTSPQIDIQHQPPYAGTADLPGLLRSCDASDRPDSSAWLDPQRYDNSIRDGTILRWSACGPAVPSDNTRDAAPGWLSVSELCCREPQPDRRESNENRR